MGNSPTPPGLLERILLEVDRRIASFARSGFLRNATISDGGLTIKGGFMRLLASVTGQEVFYIGPVGPSGPDGTPQQGWQVRRADGSTVLELRDQFPGDDGGLFNQALNWFDRTGHIVFADDTNSGQGIARPYVPMGTFARARYSDWTVSTTSDTFETLWRGEMFKQHPRISVATMASMDTAGTTGEVRVMIEGVQFGTTKSIGFALLTSLFGPGSLPDIPHMTLMHVEIQGRRTGGAGALKVEPLHMVGRQS